jgi:hypothetical protein
MTTDPTAPRDVSGTPGHEALRAYWEVPPGGLNPKRPTATPPGGDILSNLRRSQVQRSNAIGAANRPAALAAHEDYLKGATYRQLQEKYHLAPATLRAHWRAAGLAFAGIGERRPRVMPQ